MSAFVYIKSFLKLRVIKSYYVSIQLFLVHMRHSIEWAYSCINAW